MNVAKTWWDGVKVKIKWPYFALVLYCYSTAPLSIEHGGYLQWLCMGLTSFVYCMNLLQEKLPEGLAQEAEKALYNLVCFSTERAIRTKFIQACVENLGKHRWVEQKMVAACLHVDILRFTRFIL